MNCELPKESRRHALVGLAWHRYWHLVGDWAGTQDKTTLNISPPAQLTRAFPSKTRSRHLQYERARRKLSPPVAAGSTPRSTSTGPNLACQASQALGRGTCRPMHQKRTTRPRWTRGRASPGTKHTCSRPGAFLAAQGLRLAVQHRPPTTDLNQARE